ncbi:MAG: hypothetical protein JXA75_03025 [Candidatus Thermoplasmatota archaeon]|nr:hypothetical protein [Candidatus Thermoplasmatota archaeon]
MKHTIPRALLVLGGFFILANLPFLTMSYFLGVETFLDSFEHPSSFLYLKNEQIQTLHPQEGYLILEKPSSEDFSIEEGDMILCYTTTHRLEQHIVSRIQSEDGVTTYYASTNTPGPSDAPICDSQIVGKISGTMKETLWNNLCLSFWDVSINHLNILAFFTP